MRSDIILIELKGLIVKFKSVQALVTNVGPQIVYLSLEVGALRLEATLKYAGWPVSL